MQYIAALFIFALVYVLVEFLLKKVPALAGLAEILAVLAGGLGALFYLGVLN